MVIIREIFTEEMQEKYDNTSELSDNEYIAYFDTFSVLKKLTESDYFGYNYAYFSSLVESVSKDRLNKILENPPEFKKSIMVNEIADCNLVQQFYLSEDLKLLSNNKLLTLLIHFKLIIELTNYNKIYNFLLRFASQIAINELNSELLKRGIPISND